MAVFVSGLDETAGKTHRDTFLLAGFVAPEHDWSRFFAPAWQERVLDGPPAIPYLHMTEIRSPKWREKYGLSKLEADDRIDTAIALIVRCKAYIRSASALMLVLSVIDLRRFE